MDFLWRDPRFAIVPLAPIGEGCLFPVRSRPEQLEPSSSNISNGVRYEAVMENS